MQQSKRNICQLQPASQRTSCPTEQSADTILPCTAAMPCTVWSNKLHFVTLPSSAPAKTASPCRASTRTPLRMLSWLRVATSVSVPAESWS